MNLQPKLVVESTILNLYNSYTIKNMVAQLLFAANGIRISLENMDNDATDFIVKEINKMQSKEKG